ncbi:hypothetical protein DFH11DRAFT_1567220 [Phellopilus nigrolimitatus]|nr:hypothetical protein DFH11DRAFT_1567220 [Phellopilus nigrolimitatus]
MASRLSQRISRILTLSSFFSLVLTVAPSTNTPVPPLQWIELTDLLSGSSPPGLKYASIGYDSTSQTLIIFGGESNGFPLQQTYLLNVSSLTWSSPNPPVAQASVKPPARSAAISGGDFAASNRHGHLVIGGKGLGGTALSDAWEYDYVNQFWTELTISPGGPGARYSASGGIDATSSPVSDVTVPGPNNTFYLAGGYDGQTVSPLSDVWKFEVAGVLSPNLAANNTFGSWTKIDFPDDLPTRVRQGGTVMPSARVIAADGCNSTESSDNLCAQQDSHVLNINTSTDISPGGCPAPRVGPVMVPNYNAFSESFASQVFMLLGTFNSTLWDDGNGLSQGEVDVLDIETGTWSRVLPSGDPAANPPKFPVPREGAVGISSAHSLVGANPSVGADIIVFGGQDSSGNYLNDVWLLRTYSASLTTTNASWSGSGDGTLDTGVNAAGAGVTIQYLSSCASAKSSGATATATSPTSPTSTSSPPGSTESATLRPFNTHVSHKVLSPVSVALLLAALVSYRLSLSSTIAEVPSSHHSGFVWIAVAGVVIAFTSISLTSDNSLRRRSASSSLFLKTSHGKAALAFLIALYGLLPLFFGLSYLLRGGGAKVVKTELEHPEEVARKESTETGFTALSNNNREKAGSRHRAANSSPDVTTQSIPLESPVSGSRSRARSLLSGHLWSSYRSKERPGRPSYESAGHESEGSSAGPSRSFEVLNRGGRARRLSANGLNGYSSETGHAQQPGLRNINDLNWLDRRQNVAAFGELDYALTQINHTQSPTPVGDARSTGPLFLSNPSPEFRPLLPSKTLSLLHVLLHAAILGICVVVLVQLWQRAPKATFAVFLIWTVAFYCVLYLLAWREMPKASIPTLLFSSLTFHGGLAQGDPHSSRRLSTVASEQYAFPSESRSPYTFHQPLFRRALSAHEDERLSSSGHGGQRPDDEDDEEDETQQRRIEQEMDRRDVSIVTVPKRKLWITNPS